MDSVKKLAAALAPLCGVDETTLSDWIEVPKNTAMGGIIISTELAARDP